MSSHERLYEVPTRVEVIDARDGSPVRAARWRSSRITSAATDWLPSGTVGPCLRTRRPAVDLPDGWTTFEEWWPGATMPEGFVEARAQLLVFPEANVRLALAGTEASANGTHLRILFAFVDGEPAEGVRDDVDAAGVHRVRGIPLRPNGALVLVLDRVQAGAPHASDAVSFCDSQEAEITILPDRALLVRATLPATESEVTDLHVDVMTLALEDRPSGSSSPPSCIRFVTGTEETDRKDDPWALLDVAVRAVDGSPAPFSNLDLETTGPVGYADLDDDGLLRLDPYTDRHGRRTFHRVPPGPVRVVARYRGRRIDSRFEVRAGERRVLVLTLPE